MSSCGSKFPLRRSESNTSGCSPSRPSVPGARVRIRMLVALAIAVALNVTTSDAHAYPVKIQASPPEVVYLGGNPEFASFRVASVSASSMEKLTNWEVFVGLQRSGSAPCSDGRSCESPIGSVHDSSQVERTGETYPRDLATWDFQIRREASTQTYNVYAHWDVYNIFPAFGDKAQGQAIGGPTSVTVGGVNSGTSEDGVGGGASGGGGGPGPEPIIYVPGFMGSTLICGDREVWVKQLDLSGLRLAGDGVTDAGCGSPVEVGEVLGRVQLGPIGSPIYEGALKYLGELVEKEDKGRQVIPFAYDWRKSPNLAALKLEALVQSFTQKDGKVVIVAHSMGGLVTRRLLDRPGMTGKVARAVTIGTPYLGSPKALFPLAAGISTPALDPLDALLRPNSAVREFAKNLAGLYYLWPSETYGEWLTLQGKRLDAEGVVRVVRQLDGNPLRLMEAWSDHANHFDHLSTGGVPYHVVVGTGVNTTGSVEITQYGALFGSGHYSYLVKWADGDGTVPTRSATLGDPTRKGRFHYVCGVDHMPLGSDRRVFDSISSYLLRGGSINTMGSCPTEGTEWTIYNYPFGDLTGEGASARVRSAATSLPLARAKARGLIQHLDLGRQQIVVTNARHPLKLAIRGRRFTIVARHLGAGGRKGHGRFFGPLHGAVTLNQAGRRAKLLRGREMLAPRGADRRPPVTRARVRRGVRISTVLFRPRDASGVAATYARIGKGPARRVRRGLRLRTAALSELRFQSIDIFGNAERPRALKQRGH
jgi:pimeloyl-ACP methyl ester carboxylesterase